MNEPWHPDEILLRRNAQDEWEALRAEAPDRVVCHFCVSADPVTDYDCADYQMGLMVVNGEVQEHWSRGGFLACRECARLIDQGRFSWLVERMVRCWNAAHPEHPADADHFHRHRRGFRSEPTGSRALIRHRRITMKTILRWLLPMAVAGAVAAGVASAQTSATSVSWPATCELKATTLGKWQCADGHLNSLDSRLRAQGVLLAHARSDIAALKARNGQLASCIAEFPISRYYDPNYYFYGSDSNNDGNFDQNNFVNNASTQMDQTHQGDSVDFWMLRDTCSTAAFGRPPAP